MCKFPPQVPQIVSVALDQWREARTSRQQGVVILRQGPDNEYETENDKPGCLDAAEVAVSIASILPRTESQELGDLGKIILITKMVKRLCIP